MSIDKTFFNKFENEGIRKDMLTRGMLVFCFHFCFKFRVCVCVCVCVDNL